MISGYYRQCPSCKAPLVIINGELDPRATVEVVKELHRLWIIPHVHDCLEVIP